MRIVETSRLMKDYSQAQEYLQNISSLETNIEALTEAAALEEKLGNVDKAQYYYSKGLKLQRDYAPFYRRYGWFLIKLGDVSGGTDHLVKSDSIDSKNMKTHKKLGRAYLLSDDSRVEDAFKYFNLVNDKDPNDYIGILGLAQAHERKGEYEAALDYLKVAIQSPKADLNCQFFMGTVYSKLREFKKAQEIFRTVLSKHCLKTV